ncbi:MAG: nuclear transport factor 2 family protein [Parvibaculaceae bacterium]
MPADNAVTPELMDRLVEAFNALDADKVMSFFADDCVFHASRGRDAAGERFEGRKAVGEAFRSRFAAIPDIHFSDGEHWIMGEKVMSKWRVTGTLPGGQRLDCRGCDLWVFKDGKVVSKDTYYKQVEA